MSETDCTEGFRLSPRQRHLWQLQKLGSPESYRSICAVRIHGPLSRRRFRLSLHNTIERHEILRTSFRCLSGKSTPLQVISDEPMLELEEIDLSSFETTDQRNQIDAIWKDELCGQLQLQLHRQPLRVKLLILAPHQHVCMISLPSLCTDRCGLENLVAEVARVYESHVSVPESDDEPLQYADLAEWLNDLMESDETRAGRNYWRQSDFAKYLSYQLPGERRDNNQRSFQPIEYEIAVQADSLKQLRRIAAQNDVAVKLVLLACWQVLLWRLSGDALEATVVGVAYGGRKYDELALALGLFESFLPVVLAMTPGQTFTDILKRADDEYRSASEKQEFFCWETCCPANQLPEHGPFLPYCFEFADKPAPICRGDLTFEIERKRVCVDRYKVKLSCTVDGDSLRVMVSFDSRLLTNESVHRISEQWLALLGSVISNPSARINDLDFIGADERRLVLHQFNETECEPSEFECLHHLFEHQVSRCRNHCAVVCAGENLTL